MNIIKKTALYFARKKYCKAAIETRADLSAIREKPTPKMVIGLGLIVFSYLIGLPTVIALGVLAVSMGKPLLGIIGGVVIYAISTVLFVIGVKIAGEKYFHLFTRWLVRVVLEKILGEDIRALYEAGSDNKCSQD